VIHFVAKIRAKENIQVYFCIFAMPMKRLLRKYLALLLLLLYLPTVNGIQVCAHYCGNALQSISFYTHADEADCCGTEKKADCCHEKVKVCKLDEQHQGSEVKVVLSPLSAHAILQPESYVVFSNTLVFCKKPLPNRARQVVRRPAIPYYKLYEVYRI